ncbi:ApaG protein [Lishizhenia tianjinensis]|uniref:ApaG protein n=1 Tax=Lishizhenia tianjinensis TaxID=477690 RepID=A0A1I7AEM8_9FLAO|nr:Co2+/Mg2+ efflux protein ApaG [Lishizhenia tianjinensis]SFT73353.1 ApaG protein [Lishizhenia tianjinensis]
MNTAINSGVKISVSTQFRPDLSRVYQSVYFFTYKVEIENRNPFAVQLLSRFWRIFDSLDELRTVQGEGVIGEQPILEPGEVYTYSSGCDFVSELGSMSGYYIFQRLDTHKLLQVDVPKFDMIYLGRVN